MNPLTLPFSPPLPNALQINHLVTRGELWRLLTPSLVHAGLLHLGVNMLSLHLLGPSVEAYLGRTRFLGRPRRQCARPR